MKTCATREPKHSVRVMLLALTCGFGLSQAWRTVAAIMAAPLQADFHLSAQALEIGRASCRERVCT